jgi:hypothetical protein
LAFHPFLWEAGSIFDLQTLIVPGSDITLSDVRNINERGEIAALGLLPNGDTHVVLLVPCGNDDCKNEASAMTSRAIMPVSGTVRHSNRFPGSNSMLWRRGTRGERRGNSEISD